MICGKCKINIDKEVFNSNQLCSNCQSETMIPCVICGDKIERGNNAEPYCKGQCCDYCNREVVIPCRMKLILGERK